MGTTPAPVVSDPNNGTQPVTLTWSFGATATVNSSPVTITYSARVMNVAANQAGNEKTNLATLDYHLADNSSAPRQTDSSTIAIGEPALTLTKAIQSPPDPDDAGGRVTYKVTIANPETETATTAYDLHLLDTLPAELALDTLSITLSNPTGVTSSSDGTKLDLIIPSLSVGDSLIVTYSATLQDTIQPGQTVANTATVTWTSQSGANDRNAPVPAWRQTTIPPITMPRSRPAQPAPSG
jgi:fimbrial isopeptide formation D2 family protein